MNKKSEKLTLIAKWAFLLIVLAGIYLPLFMIILYSFSASREVGGEFGNFTFALYKNLFNDTKLLSATKNTLIIGAASASIATILGTTAAVGIHYMKTKTKTAMDAASQITIVNAEIVTAMGFFLLIIFLRDAVQLPAQFGLGWLIVTHTVITTPYVILTVSPRLKQLNPNLLEASMDLGAGPMRSLIKVMLPQLAGAMVASFAMAFTLSLDDFVVTNINAAGSGVETISTYVYSGIKRNMPTDIRALSTIIFVVVLGGLIVFNIIKDRKAKNLHK